MRHYEIAAVFHPDLEIDLETAIKKVEKIVTDTNGTVDHKDNWGKRKLAYQINGQDWGIFVFFQVSLETKAVAEIESSLRITDEVMRYLVVSLEHQRLVNKRKNSKKATKAEGESAKQEVKEEKAE